MHRIIDLVPSTPICNVPFSLEDTHTSLMKGLCTKLSKLSTPRRIHVCSFVRNSEA